MKINICLSEQDSIDGYNNISINQIPNIINGSVDEIMFKKLDNIPYQDRISTLSSLLNKIKYNGHLILEITDIMQVGRDMSSGTLTSKTASAIIAPIVSVCYEFDILNQLANFPNFTIQNRYGHNYKLTINITKTEN